MPTYYYNLKVAMCRERGDTRATGSISHSEPTRQDWVFTHSETNDNGGVAHGLFRDAVEAAIGNAPQHVKLIQRNGTGSLKKALEQGGSMTNDGVPSAGPWSERVGKDVFRYEIGVSSTSAADALSLRTAHNLA
jgi:hypothetical protein